MKTASGILCIAFCLFVGLPQGKASGIICTSGAGNLVDNCGFETGDFTGWTLSGSDVPRELNYLYGVEGTDTFDGISPNGGSYQAYFADLVASATTISQTLATSAGASYTVSWYLVQDTAIIAPYSNEFSASFNGVSLVSLSAMPVEGYTEYTYTGTASGSSTVLSFTLGNDVGEYLLDDVSVAPESSSSTPEPATWELALGGAVLALVFHRKRTARGAAL